MMPPSARSGCRLASELLDADDDELGRLQRREADNDIDDSEIDVALRRGFAVALHEVRITRRGALERALAKQRLHKGANIQPDRRPQRFVVRLEHRPLQAPAQALLEEQSSTADRNVFVFVRQLVRTTQRPGTPHHLADDRKGTQTVDAELIKLAVFGVGKLHGKIGNIGKCSLNTSGRLPDTAAGIGSREDAGYGAAGSKSAHLVAA